MPTSKPLRALWALLLLVSVANAVRVLRDPDAMQFFGTAFVVIAAVAVVGTIVALLLTALRRLSA
jgi:hypothetical protein